MIIKREEYEQKKPVIDLGGPDGNAFALMGLAQSWCKQLGKDFGPIQEDMTSGDYDHLLSVMEREFGEYVIFIKS